MGTDRARSGLRVKNEGLIEVGDDGLVDIPLRMHVGNGLVLHPRGKALVEPDVIPPLHRHQVAEPRSCTQPINGLKVSLPSLIARFTVATSGTILRRSVALLASSPSSATTARPSSRVHCFSGFFTTSRKVCQMSRA